MIDQQIIRQAALENAMRFKGKANAKAVFGMLAQTHKEIVQQRDEYREQIQSIVDQINALSYAEQKEQIVHIHPSFFDEQQQRKDQQVKQRQQLPALNIEPGQVVKTRMAPEPSKYPHLGHAMSFLINYLYAKMYGGVCYLRFDDTNPETSQQEYVDAVLDGVVHYMGLRPESIIYASDYMEQFMQYAQQLIDNGHAYVCSCSQQEMSAQRRQMVASPHRNQTIEQTKLLWQQLMQSQISGVLRLRIAPDHKNAVMRDPVIYRRSDVAHYRCGTNYKVWPMYDFETAVMESLLGVTHVMRSNEFDSRIELQQYITTLLGLGKVQYRHYGRYQVVGSLTQGREIRNQIENGTYRGWDDPRLVTLQALRRRGIDPESFIRLAKQIGMSKTQTNLDFSVIAAINRQVLDEKAKRYFCVRHPVEIHIKGAPHKTYEVPVHPVYDWGTRSIVSDGVVLIEQEDDQAIPPNSLVRLMDTMTVRKVTQGEWEYVDDQFAPYKKECKHIIHYVPASQSCSVDLMNDDGSLQAIQAEQAVRTIQPGEVIQFQRFAFCRVDSHTQSTTTVWYAHQ